MKTCENCKFWDYIKKYNTISFGVCDSEKIITQEQDINNSEDSLIFSLRFKTGPKFGCIHFEKKK